jgi:glycosyltransferase involved in cell wall biosynthesis
VKVLHLFKTYLPDSFTGIERVIWEIAEGLASHGVESRVLSLSDRPRPEGYSVGRHVGYQAKCDFYVASTGLSLSVFKAFRELSKDVDIVHYHFPWPMMDLMHLLGRPHCPAVITYHSDIVRQRMLRRLYGPLMHRFLASADRIVATSPNYIESSPVLQAYRAKTAVIPIGLADEAAPSAELVEHWRSRVGEGFFLFVGALRYYKGLPFLLEAARQTGLPLVVAGNGEMEAEIPAGDLPNLQLVEEFSDRDKAALLSLCKAFVFPSHLRSEAFGIALLEAARAGKPMISCEIGTGTTYVNKDGETGIVVRPEDAAGLAAAMRKLAAAPDLVLQMGHAARARYERLFRAEDMCRQYLTLYRQLSAENPGSPPA